MESTASNDKRDVNQGEKSKHDASIDSTEQPTDDSNKKHDVNPVMVAPYTESPMLKPLFVDTIYGSYLGEDRLYCNFTADKCWYH